MAAPPRQSQIAPGYRLDRYEMLCPIAEGGMASVWIARLRGKRGFEKLVAIKTILPKYAEDPRFERMFLDEAALAARIEHANVAQVLDLGEEHDVLFLAMELVDGDSLKRLHRTVIKQGMEMPVGIVLRIMADVCGGLHAAHELRGEDGQTLGVVHRDVSPHNILVSMSGSTKLIDFGIAKARDRVSEETADGTMKGKIHYMGPEQAVGKPVDRRADIWAVGSCIYFLLTGRAPYAADNDLATLHLITSGAAPTPLPATIHPSIRAVVHQALAAAPEMRFQTADQLQHALEMAMIDARVVTSTSNVAAFVQHHMADRARKRKEGLELALSAAAQREQVAKMLERAGAESSSGLPGHTATDHNTDSSIVPPPLYPSHASHAPNPISVSSATLGSALASPIPAMEAEPRRTVAAAIGLGVGLCIAAACGLAFLRYGHAPEVAAASAPPSAAFPRVAAVAAPASPPPVAIASPPPPPPSPPADSAERPAVAPVVGIPESSIPAIAASSLPVASAPAPAVVHHAPSAPSPKPGSTTPAPPKQTRVDYGF